MKILVLSWRYVDHPRAGGADVLTHEVLKRLVARGHVVCCFTAAHPGASREGMIDGVRIIRQGRPWTVHFHAWRWLRKNINEWDRVVDQVNTIPFFTPWYVPSGKRRFHINQLARGYWWRQTSGVWRVLAPLGYGLEPWTIRRYRNTRGFAISSSTKGDLVQLGIPRANIGLIPMAITTPALPRLARKPGPPWTLITVGRLTPAKYVEETVRAFERVRRRLPQARLWIVGTGDRRYRAKLDRLIAKRGIGGVTFHDRVSDARRQHLLRQSHLLVFTSHREGWGLVVSEAGAAGTPAVGYDVPGVRDSIGDPHLLSPAGDHRDLADRAVVLLRDRRAYGRARQKAWQRARSLSYDRTTDAFLEAIT